MKDLFSKEPPATLTPELLELHAELTKIGIRERASFAPELAAELSREWSEMKTARPGSRFGGGPLVGIAAVLFLALVYTPARALIRLIDAIRPTTSVELVQVEPLVPKVELSGAAHETLAIAPPRSEPIPDMTVAMREGARVDAGELTVFEPADFTFPRVADPDALQAVLEQHYPRHLQDARVGGKVRVRLWVDPNGSPSLVQVRGSSGVPDLDQAARDAASNLSFEPARWLGYPVGTWVEFDLGFDPAVMIA
jgi:TonB family protein